MNKGMVRKYKESGVVSLFAVLFTTLILTVMTIGFIRIMLQEQRQAMNQDLSQSAYDSAVSGVEDAKRALRACLQQGTGLAACNAINNHKCSTIQDAGIVSSNSDSETTIVSGTSKDTSLNQAYTCVVVQTITDDYLGNVLDGQSSLVPLKATGAFNKIVIEWMHKDDGTGSYAGGGVANITAPVTSGTLGALPPRSGWATSAPALMRVLAVLPAQPDTVALADLDGPTASTAFLWPSVTGASINEVKVDTITGIGTARATSSGGALTQPVVVACSNNLYTSGGYACRATLTMPAGQSVPAGSTVAFLRLNSLYHDTSYRVTLQRDDTPVTFDGVQPIVDSTGRADNVFRRVLSRLNYSSYVDDSIMGSANAAISVTGNLCKDFYITDTEAKGDGCDTRVP